MKFLLNISYRFQININWRDSESKIWNKSKLFRDGIEVLSTTIKNQYKITPYVDILLPNIIYKYKVVNYDLLDEQIQVC